LCIEFLSFVAIIIDRQTAIDWTANSANQ